MILYLVVDNANNDRYKHLYAETKADAMDKGASELKTCNITVKPIATQELVEVVTAEIIDDWEQRVGIRRMGIHNKTLVERLEATKKGKYDKAFMETLCIRCKYDSRNKGVSDGKMS